MLPSEAIRLIKFLKEASKLRTDNLEKPISLIPETSDLVFNNTSIWVLSMIHSLVFSAWTSTWFSKDQEAESVSEEDANPESEPNTESQRIKPCNGSEENTMVPSTTDSSSLFKLYRFFSFFKLNFCWIIYLFVKISS